MKKDIWIISLAGFFTGLLWSGIFIRLGTLARFHLGNKIWGLVIVVPVIFVFGLYLGKWLSGWKPFFGRFAKFVAIGFFNAGVDFGVFNLLIYLTGIEKGLTLTLFKSVSFIASFTNSYFWNKYWTFNAGKTSDGKGEFVKYAVVTLIGAAINIGISTLIINLIKPAFGFSQLGWDNMAVVFATIGNLIWNFIGYQLIVFKTKQETV
jgi:putative flippase GtrA